MEQRKLGTQGLVVSAIGLGCMQMSGIYGSADEAEAIATIHEAYMRENTASADLKLTTEDLAWIEEKIPAGAAFGDRYTEGGMQMLDV